MGWDRGGRPRRRHSLPSLHSSLLGALFPHNCWALEVHNGRWKLNLWAGNRSWEIEEQRAKSGLWACHCRPSWPLTMGWGLSSWDSGSLLPWARAGLGSEGRPVA